MNITKIDPESIDLSQPALFIDMFYFENTAPEIEPKTNWIRYPVIILYCLMILLAWFTVAETPECNLNDESKRKASEWLFLKNILTRISTPEPENKSHDVKTMTAEVMLKLHHQLYSDARAILDAAEKDLNHPSDRMKTVEAFRWAADLEEFIYKKNPTTPIVVFRDEDRIASIISRWEKNKNDIYPVLYYSAVEAFGEKHPEFLHKISDDLRTVYTYNHAYLKEIENLKLTIEKELEANRFPDHQIEDFKKKYPDVGLILLEEDLENFRQLLQLIHTKPLQVTEFMNRIKFNDPLFVDKANQLITQSQKQSYNVSFSSIKIMAKPTLKALK